MLEMKNVFWSWETVVNVCDLSAACLGLDRANAILSEMSAPETPSGVFPIRDIRLEDYIDSFVG